MGWGSWGWPPGPSQPHAGVPLPHAAFLALWGDANEHHVPCLPSAGAGALMGWGRGWGQVWGQRWHCRGCSCWLPAPRPRGPWLWLLTFPRKPDSRGIFVPRRISLIRSLHKSAARTHAPALTSGSSKALPTHPAGAPGARMDGAERGHHGGPGTDPVPSPGRGSCPRLGAERDKGSAGHISGPWSSLPHN